MHGCMCIFLNDGTRIEMGYYPSRKKPVIVLHEPDGSASGHAVFHDEQSMRAFMELFDRILRSREA